MGSNYQGYSTPASWAVDGNRDPMYSTTFGFCAYIRAEIWTDLYWLVDLENRHVIYNLTVYGTDLMLIPGGMRYIKLDTVKLINSVQFLVMHFMMFTASATRGRERERE